MSDKPVPPQPNPNAPLPDGKPLFLKPDVAQAAPYVGAPPDPNDQKPNFDYEVPESAGNTEAGEDIPRDVKVRWLEAARLHALGRTNNEIADKMGYSPAWVSTLLSKPLVRKEVYRYRNKLYEQDLLTAMKDLGPDAISVLTEMLHNPKEKLKDRAEAAKWLLEKLTGKAKQEVTHESNTLATFIDVLKKMQATGQSFTPAQPAGETIDVTPNKDETKAIMPAPAPSKWANWSKSNI